MGTFTTLARGGVPLRKKGVWLLMSHSLFAKEGVPKLHIIGNSILGKLNVLVVRSFACVGRSDFQFLGQTVAVPGDSGCVGTLVTHVFHCHTFGHTMVAPGHTCQILSPASGQQPENLR